MRKLIHGIIEFQSKKASDYRNLFAKLALGQTPDAFFLACSDSRVAANVFASTDPGDLFVMRNVGNIFPPYRAAKNFDSSAYAALEFAVSELKVKHIIVCGHSQCGGMIALLKGLDKMPHPGLKAWLRTGEDSISKVPQWVKRFPNLEPHDALSQLNVIAQIENFKTYPLIQKSHQKMHGLWFDLKKLLVYYYFEETDEFEIISQSNFERILNKL